MSKCDLFQNSPVVFITDNDDPGHVELARYRKLGPDGAIHVSVKTEEGLSEVTIL